MANEVKNDMAVVQITDAVGGASHLIKYVTNQSDARQIYDQIMHLAYKLSDKHNFALTVKSEFSNKGLKP